MRKVGTLVGSDVESNFILHEDLYHHQSTSIDSSGIAAHMTIHRRLHPSPCWRIYRGCLSIVSVRQSDQT
jgi:hypothetical protein